MRSASRAILRVPILMPTWANTELSEKVVARAERGDAGVGALVVVDGEDLLRLRDVELDLPRGPDRVRGDALAQGLGEDERLDGRAGLALALGREVERQLLVVVAADHRPDLAGVVVDRDQRGARAVPVGQPGVDRLVGGVLQLAVDRGPDAQAALEGLPRALLAAAELVHDLLLDPGREVRVVAVLLGRLEVAAHRELLLDRVLVLLRSSAAPGRACTAARGCGGRARRRDWRSGRRRSARRSCRPAAPPRAARAARRTAAGRARRSRGGRAGSRCAPPPRCRRRRCRSRSCSGSRWRICSFEYLRVRW